MLIRNGKPVEHATMIVEVFKTHDNQSGIIIRTFYFDDKNDELCKDEKSLSLGERGAGGKVLAEIGFRAHEIEAEGFEQIDSKIVDGSYSGGGELRMYKFFFRRTEKDCQAGTLN